jgi:S1-C subfamily serine protease
MCLPLLCFLAIGLRIGMRRRDTKVRESWDRVLCTLLIASGLVTSVAFTYFLALSSALSSIPHRSSVPYGLRSLQQVKEFPHFPSAVTLNAEQIASQSKAMVFILTPDPGFEPSPNYLSLAPVAAATLLLADGHGYLFCTSRHVVDEKSFPSIPPVGNQFMIFSHEGDHAPVEVVGRNRDLDLAILWEPQPAPHAQFSQPIAISSTIHTGEQVFVIGHPQRLFYTLSAGLVSRVEDPQILQFSAPISPGNSGGPVYDSSGNLLGIVASMVDRGQNPNAENLNFAVRSEAFLRDAGWDLNSTGRTELTHLRQTQPNEASRQDH